MMTEIKNDVKVLSSVPGPMFLELKPVVPSSCFLPTLLSSCAISAEPGAKAGPSAVSRAFTSFGEKRFFFDFVDPIAFSQGPQ